jgi:hypothetical protein
MANSFVTACCLHKVDSTGTLQTSATDAVVMKVTFYPAVTGDDLVIRDGQGNDAIIMKADMDVLRMQKEDFEGGRRFKGLKVQTIDGGTGYIYLAKR